MRTLIKLLLVALIVHGTWRLGSAYWSYYQFRDAVEEMTRFPGTRSEDGVRAQVLELADQMNLPVDAGRIEVRQEGVHTFIDVAYDQPVEIIPTYQYPWAFRVSVEGWAGAGRNSSPPK